MPLTCFFSTSCLLHDSVYMLDRLSQAVDRCVWLGVLAQIPIQVYAFGRMKTAPEMLQLAEVVKWKPFVWTSLLLCAAVSQFLSYYEKSSISSMHRLCF